MSNQTFEAFIYQERIPNRIDSFWYSGHVADVISNGRKIRIEAVGDIAIRFEPEGVIFKNRQAVKEADSRNYTDTDIHALEWHCNNWFRIADVYDDGLFEIIDIVSEYDEAMETAIQIQ